MSDRLDLYAPIHKGLRNAMQAALLRLGQLDSSDTVDVGEALAQLRDTLDWMENHLEIENHVLVPKVMEKQVGVSAVTVLVALLVGGSMLGLLGALLAVPTAAILQVVIQELLDERDRLAEKRVTAGHKAVGSR